MIEGLEQEVRKVRARVLELATVEVVLPDDVDAVEYARDMLRDSLKDFATSWSTRASGDGGIETWTMETRKPEERAFTEMVGIKCSTCGYISAEGSVRCLRCSNVLTPAKAEEVDEDAEDSRGED